MQVAANHWNTKPQERDRLPAKLNSLGFPFGICMECNSEYSHCYPFSHVIYSLNPHISLGSNDRPCSESLYKLNISYFFMYTLCQTPGTDGKWSVAIQMVYLLSGSPETTIQSGLITVDSESLHTYCIVTFVLR